MTTPAAPVQTADEAAAQATGAAPQLSDAGAAIAYPDVPTPPKSTPLTEDETSGTPFEQRQGKLMDLIRSAKTDWPTAEQALIDFKYAPPWKATRPVNSPGWSDEVEDAPTVPDTWNELQMATAYGMLTRDQFNAVADARWDKGGTAAGERQPAPGQDTDAAGGVAAERQQIIDSTRPTNGLGGNQITAADLGD